MAEHYSGSAMVVKFGSVDISGYARSVEITETAAAPDSLDATHKGDSARQLIEGLPGAVETNVTMTVLDIYDSLHAFGTMALNTKDTLTIYPKGETHTYPMLTVQNARLHERSEPIAHDAITEMTASWNAKNTLTRSTYSSS